MTVAAQRFVTGVAAVALWESVDADGEPAAPAGTITVTAVRASTGAAQTVAASPAVVSGSTTAYSCAITAAELGTALDRLTVTWLDDGTAVATTIVETVGGVYFRSLDAFERFPKVIVDTKHSAADIITARQAVESEFERICGRAFVPRYGEQIIIGAGHSRSLLSEFDVRSVLAVYLIEADGTETAFTAAELAAVSPLASGGIVRLDSSPFTAGYRYRVAFTYGLDQPPVEIFDAALERLKFHLGRPNSQQPTKATTFSSAEGGTYSLALASARKTGNDDIDAALEGWSMHEVAVA